MEETLTCSLTESPFPSPSRLWRPAAQRNLRNQWAKLSSYKHKWQTLSLSARSHATSLVNSSLSRRFVNARDLGVLSDFPGIKKKASNKLFSEEELHRSKLLASYKNMVAIVNQMVTIGASLRYFRKGPDNSSVLQYSNFSANTTDVGYGGGIPAFTFWSISSFAYRLLVINFFSMSNEDVRHNIKLSWMEELYSGEFDDLSKCNLYSTEVSALVFPKLEGRSLDKLKLQTECRPDEDVLQVYLTTWLADVNIDRYRVDEIFTSVGEEINVTLV